MVFNSKRRCFNWIISSEPGLIQFSIFHNNFAFRIPNFITNGITFALAGLKVLFPNKKAFFGKGNVVLNGYCGLGGFF